MPIYSKDNEFWDTTPGKRNCCVVSNDWELCQENKPNKLVLEFTLSLAKDDKEFLYKTYCKILKGIDSLYKIKDHKAYYELGGVKQHRHIHAKFSITLPTEKGSYAGLIEEIARLICKIIRRQYNEKCMLSMFNRYQSVPFCIQVNTRDTWDEYIFKQQKSKGPDFKKLFDLNALNLEEIIFF